MAKFVCEDCGQWERVEHREFDCIECGKYRCSYCVWQQGWTKKEPEPKCWGNWPFATLLCPDCGPGEGPAMHPPYWWNEEEAERLGDAYKPTRPCKGIWLFVAKPQPGGESK